MTPRTYLLSALTLSTALFSVPAFAQQQDATEPVRQAIRDYISSWQERFNGHDSKSLATIYTNNAVRVLPDGEIISGVPAIEKSLADAVKIYSDLSLKTEDVKAKGDVAWGYVHWTIMGKDEKGTPQKLTGNSTNTWLREAGTWKLVQEGVVYQAFPTSK